MTINNDNLRFVANLQVYSNPFTSLYIDISRNTLYMFLRVSAYDAIQQSYAVVDISSQDVDLYIRKRRTLTNIFCPEKVKIAHIRNNHILFDDDYPFYPTEEMHKSDRFEPEFCDELMKIKTFLKKYNSNK